MSTLVFLLLAGRFSTDEGQCWHSYNFSDYPIYFTGLASEPGARSMNVSIWGYRETYDWVSFTIDFRELLTRDCEWPTRRRPGSCNLCETSRTRDVVVSCLQAAKTTTRPGWPTPMTSATPTTAACWDTKRSFTASRRTPCAGTEGITWSALCRLPVRARWMTSCGKAVQLCLCYIWEQISFNWQWAHKVTWIHPRDLIHQVLTSASASGFASWTQ